MYIFQPCWTPGASVCISFLGITIGFEVGFEAGLADS
jgi:hypothetical protein